MDEVPVQSREQASVPVANSFNDSCDELDSRVLSPLGEANANNTSGPSETTPRRGCEASQEGAGTRTPTTPSREDANELR